MSEQMHEWSAEEWRERKGSLRFRQALHEPYCVAIRRAQAQRREQPGQHPHRYEGINCSVFRCRGPGSKCGGRIVGACRGGHGLGTGNLCERCAVALIDALSALEKSNPEAYAVRVLNLERQGLW